MHSQITHIKPLLPPSPKLLPSNHIDISKSGNLGSYINLQSIEKPNPDHASHRRVGRINRPFELIRISARDVKSSTGDRGDVVGETTLGEKSNRTFLIRRWIGFCCFLGVDGVIIQGDCADSGCKMSERRDGV